MALVPLDATSAAGEGDGAASGPLPSSGGLDVEVDAGDAAVPGVESVAAGDAGVELKVGRGPATIGDREDGALFACPRCDGAGTAGWHVDSPERQDHQVDTVCKSTAATSTGLAEPRSLTTAISLGVQGCSATLSEAFSQLSAP